jgi:type III secretory pathway component EscT
VTWCHVYHLVIIENVSGVLYMMVDTKFTLGLIHRNSPQFNSHVLDGVKLTHSQIYMHAATRFGQNDRQIPEFTSEKQTILYYAITFANDLLLMVILITIINVYTTRKVRDFLVKRACSPLN